MYIVIAKDTNIINRAFLKKTKKSAEKLINELIEGGWDCAYIIKVDRLMIGTIQIKTTE